ncbi:helix-turn-helix domain-containing protein [Streptomyces griseoviridis]|jgi:DNA-binding transcriptional MerR regulator|uniref:DNA-binding transcriptional MerR regulator n=2 Tax=Streptomyces griseoviridis TaxID=45398 RepID=A0ABT9LH76_STRGD|nr:MULTISPECIES: helix-turn-helix domain-containing protein [Streptomyces]MDP9683048.1 DNA-binding transcriptional MerR regulator [Streptomyces griseoviridis]GGS36771.1 MerR family transcriptional regulator [Streptomyces niveoruber]GGS89714.1 MerR family transcriptional regulator [Streptomyces griseoviridis]
MTAGNPLSERLDDDDYPAYTIGRAAEMLGTTPGFLRALGEARLITPLRSGGGHRRYSRYQLRIAARARELVDQGTPIEAACRIVILEDQLEEAQRINAAYRRAAAEADDGQDGGGNGDDGDDGPGRDGPGHAGAGTAG